MKAILFRAVAVQTLFLNNPILAFPVGVALATDLPTALLGPETHRTLANVAKEFYVGLTVPIYTRLTPRRIAPRPVPRVTPAVLPEVTPPVVPEVTPPVVPEVTPPVL